jgi:hypothetical protein
MVATMRQRPQSWTSQLVTEEESSIKHVLYTAKKMEKESLKAKDHALKRGTEATKLMKMSVKVKKDGVETKKDPLCSSNAPVRTVVLHQGFFLMTGIQY